MNIKLPNGTIITWEEFSNTFNPEWVTEELDKQILTKLRKIQDENTSNR